MVVQRETIVERDSLNPLITPGDVKPSHPDWEVLGVFNAGVAVCGDEVVLLLRVAERPRQTDSRYVVVPALDEQGSEMTTIKLDTRDPELDFSDPRVVRNRNGGTVCLTSISHLRVARSRDGRRFTIDDRPGLRPEGRMERWGIEDPRITLIDGRYYVAYSAVSDLGVAVGLASTSDFAEFRREGLILAPTNKDVVLFPERIGGHYYMLHRPVPDGIGSPDMWIARSPDLLHWGDHRFLMGTREGLWDNARIGAGCVPIKTDDGWLVLYHGADRRHRYCMGAALLDLDDPSRVIARLDEPLMEPEAEYETSGFFRHVVFACGAIREGDRIVMYYGASDDKMARATIDMRLLMKRLKTN
ncbi:glycoside hydrolase family 130 protein [Paenibacillus thermoaerophilus]|uniref:Glycoside hydrolase family 130 protein n=1 Tax=Paenibacillus thermoaerophilus TaxID=1215385 RepID=A0ABW2V1U2_9BACL|nr:glycoside hydrolase family 130 protein [Paenibacillus thermoaerophilus]TMV18253.1 glycosidase [Paenibacillus thermoaerophilus]